MSRPRSQPYGVIVNRYNIAWNAWKTQLQSLCLALTQDDTESNRTAIFEELVLAVNATKNLDVTSKLLISRCRKDGSQNQARTVADNWNHALVSMRNVKSQVSARIPLGWADAGGADLEITLQATPPGTINFSGFSGVPITHSSPPQNLPVPDQHPTSTPLYPNLLDLVDNDPPPPS